MNAPALPAGEMQQALSGGKTIFQSVRVEPG